MIVTQASQPVCPQPIPAPPVLPPDTVVADTSEPVPRGGTSGITLLSGEAAAVVIAQQTEPARPSPAPTGLDLSGRDLRNEDLSELDLRGANLTGVDLTGRDLTGLDLSGATLTNAKFDGANLTETKLNGVGAAGASFTSALFARTKMDNANFADAKFNGAYFGGTKDMPDLSGQEAWDQGKNMVVKSSAFTGADFSGITAKYNLIFNNSNLENTKFDGAKAPGFVGIIPGSGIGFNQSNVKNASFQGASATIGGEASDFSGSDFSNTTGNEIDIRASKLDNASFAGSSSRLKFVRADLRTVDLSVRNKDLSNSIFSDANVAGKDFSGYNFSGASFHVTGSQVENVYAPKGTMNLENLVTGTNFSGATFKGATFYDFDMRKALVDAGALDGAQVYVNESDGRYAYLGDIFKTVSGSKEAARILYAMPIVS